MAKYLFGIDVGGTTVKCGLFMENGELVEKWEIPTETSDKGVNIPTDIAETVLSKMAQKNIQNNDVLGIGMGVPGPVLADGTVGGCPNLGWTKINIVETMAALTGLHVAAGNDANVAALGEFWKGGGKGCQSAVFVTLGTGVGGGIIVDGKVIPGAFGCGGEIGHMVLDPDEPDACGCGCHGHVEQYASATGVVRLAKKEFKTTAEDSVLRRIENLTARDVWEAAKSGDSLALRVTDTFGKYLAQTLGIIASVTDPEIFIIGGGMAKAGEFLADCVRKHYGKNLFAPLRDRKIVLAEFGNDAGIYGAAKLLLSSIA
ncbi:MAG: ROK family glucokinase [Lachnospiraceae bacterium]|nr:ROK family glucokinase [Lachnospiraceae bacterium]